MVTPAELTVPTREDVIAILDTVMDPEVPVLSVCELGIVRNVEIHQSTGAVTVTVTPTYSGCPAIRVIEDDIRSALVDAGLTVSEIRTTYSPAWTTDWIPDSAKAKLRSYGIAPPGIAESGGLVQLVRARPSIECPYCGSYETEIRSEFGSTACKSVCWCRSCRQPFEKFKEI